MNDEYFAIGTIVLKIEQCSYSISITPKQNHATKIDNQEYILFHPYPTKKNQYEMIISPPQNHAFHISECIAKQLYSVAATSILTKIIIKKSGSELSIVSVEFPAK